MIEHGAVKDLHGSAGAWEHFRSPSACKKWASGMAEYPGRGSNLGILPRHTFGAYLSPKSRPKLFVGTQSSKGTV